MENKNVKPNEVEAKEIIEKKDFTKDNKVISIIFHIVAVVCIIIFCSAISPKTLQNDTFYTIPIG